MTKTMSAIYNVTTSEWTIRDNGQVIAQGQGKMSWARKLTELKNEATKPIKVSTRH